jgi:hypothetical protein
MTYEAEFVRPPWIGTWLVSLFTPAGAAESITGDLMEEYSELAAKSGPAFARRWFWRQILTAIVHLAGAGFRAAPWLTAAAVAGGYFLMWAGVGLYGQAFGAALDKLGVYEYISDAGSRQPSINVAAEYMLRINIGRMVGRFFVVALIGGIVAWAVRGREMTVTMAIALLLFGLSLVSCFMMVARAGTIGILLNWGGLIFVFGDAIPIAIGGAVVRTRRLAAAKWPMAT